MNKVLKKFLWLKFKEIGSAILVVILVVICGIIGFGIVELIIFTVEFFAGNNIALIFLITIVIILAIYGLYRLGKWNWQKAEHLIKMEEIAKAEEIMRGEN